MHHALEEIDSKPARPQRRGRAMRIAKPSTPYTNIPPPQSRLIPSYNLLNESSLVALEHQADWLLENVGVEFRGDTIALELFRQAGASVEGERVKFENGLARQLCSTAPQEFTLHSRGVHHSVILGGDNIVLMPGYGSPFVTDLNNGRRYATLEDFQNFVKLTYATPYLHHSGGTVCEPTDIPVNKRHLDMVYAHLSLSTKPFMGGVTSPQRALDSIQMARLVFGEEYMETHAVMQGNINANSPFIYDDTMSSALRVYADANQCVCVSPAIFGGAMGPVTPAAMAAQTLAEGMVGIALTQLVRRGCPAVLGSFHSTMNLRTGSLSFGTPEANLVTMAISQLGKRLGVPTRSGGGQITAANSPDGQAMADSANAMWTTMMSGAHQVWHSAGWLEGGLTMSYEKFIMDLDNCGSMLRLFQGMRVDEDTFSKQSYKEVEPGQNFLSTSHTIANFANANYDSLLPDSGPYEAWLENGSKTAAERANSVWKEMLSNYEKPVMDESINKALLEFIAERKASMPDEWY